MEHVTVGLFNLPGIRFGKTQLSEELQNEIAEWCQENKCGMQMNQWLWSFTNEAHRDWFVLRWTDTIVTNLSAY